MASKFERDCDELLAMISAMAVSAPAVTIKGAAEGRFPAWVQKEADEFKVPIKYSELVAMPDSVHFSLMPKHYETVKKVLDCYLDDTTRTVYDLTAHVGVDSLCIATLYPAAQVTAIELDPEVHAALAKNAATRKNIKTVCADATKFEIKAADLVFLDPPWGGVDYHLRKEVPLELSGIRVEKFIARLMKNPEIKQVMLKVPANFTFSDFNRELDEYVLTEHGIPRIGKTDKGEYAYLLLVVRRWPPLIVL